MSMQVSAIGPAHPKPRGVKRKRGKVPPVDPGAKIRGKLHHGLKVIHKAAKKEKTFEIQRLIKQKKGGGGQKQDDYDEQLNMLKVLDPECAANLATKTKMSKDKFLSQNDTVRAAVETELSSDLLVLSEPGTAARVVESRFLSSKRLATEIQTMLQAIKDELLGTSEGKAVRPLAMLKAKAKSDKGDSTIRAQGASRIMGKADSGDDDESLEAEDGEDGEEEGAGWESGTVADRNPEGDWESGSVDDTGTSRGRDGGTGRAVSEEHDESDPEASGVSNASSPPAVKRKKQPEPKATVQAIVKDSKGKSKASTAESTFLPSLSVGFIRGDSDGSDWSDAEANVADGVRKNRRGQRARRAIWEKKYGRNANHVKEAASRDGRRSSNRSNPSAKRGPMQDRGIPEGTARRPGVHSASRLPGVSRSLLVKASTASGPALARPTTKEEKPLHPSWEAKKRLKEKQNPVILPAQGKKIIFD